MASYHTALSLDWNDIFFVSSKGNIIPKFLFFGTFIRGTPLLFSRSSKTMLVEES